MFQHAPPRLDQRVGERDFGPGQESFQQARINKLVDRAIEVFHAPIDEHRRANVGQIAVAGKIGAMIGNDAGMGKNNAGISGFDICDTHGIPVAAVASMSAMIGSGVSTYEEGTVSAANIKAAKLGVSEGMSAKQAAERFLEALVKRRKA